MPTALILEDDVSNMQIFAALLWSAGFTVLEATGGSEAIEIGKHNYATLDLLLADIAVPERSGTDVALELIRWHPAMAILFVTGTPFEAWDNHDLNNFRRLPRSRLDVLVKPFRPTTLLAKISELLGVGASPMPLRV